MEQEKNKPWAFSRRVFCDGMRDGFPIALGYFAVAFSLGIAARHAGFTPMQGFWASLLNNASAGEYAAFTLIAAKATYWEVAVITLIANARYLLMSCALAQRFAPGTPFWHHHRPARPFKPLLHLRRDFAGSARMGCGYGAGHYGGQCTAAAGSQRAERGAVRHVFGDHHPTGAEEPHHCRAGGAEFRAEPCL